MREAYTRYAAGVPDPIRFDSFRRWVTEGRVWSRKVGRFKEIQENCLDALIRAHAKPMGPRIGDAFLATKPEDGPLLLVTVSEELVEEKGGTVPEGMAWIGEDSDWEVFKRIIDQIHDLGEAFDQHHKTWSYKDGDRTFRCWFKNPAAVITLDTMETVAEKMIEAVQVATVEWMLDWMESRNTISSSLNEEGKRLWSKVPEFAEAWKQYHDQEATHQ